MSELGPARRLKNLEPAGTARATAMVCEAASCLSSGSGAVHTALVDALEAAGVDDVGVKRVGCLGLCAGGPLVSVPETGELYREVTAAGAPELAAALAAADPTAPRAQPDPFFARQVRVVTEHLGRIDPESLDDYLAVDGYAALERALAELSPGEVLAEVTASGLRGRGGAGYPTGLKWQTVAKAPGAAKYVICNADEGDPGAFMDRSVLESDPHRVLEGMALAAYAVGAGRGYVYCRAEYPLALSRLKLAIRQAERAGWLGADIAESRFSFTVEVRVGAGAFVCGEETALIASLQGGRGTPVPRPPYPATSGLWGAPTLINNVETFASVAPIVDRGGAWYAGIGTGRSKGTKVFALAGRVRNTGLVEVPLGITLREVVFDIGGGIVDDRPFKAVQTGGPSGGCIPADHLDMPIDYESLAAVGSIMGSGGMIVMDSTSCMVDVARYFMDFCRRESCGKCIPCRVGTTQAWMLLTRITTGAATRADLDRLESLCSMVGATSLCGLGQTAPNPVFSTLRFFRDEYLAHIDERRCPAGVCTISVEKEAVRR
ncbi:MAG TPA: NuoF family protein [Acidimicrobiales bacterium]|nr:NuoF family protein [Acidimicrobiales bacterium]